MGKERSTVANYIRLLKLPPDIQVAVRTAVITMGHARALINVDQVDKQLFVFSEIKKNGLSVRQTEELARNASAIKPASQSKKTTAPKLSYQLQKVQEELSKIFDTSIEFKTNKKGKGQIIINFKSKDELERIL